MRLDHGPLGPVLAGDPHGLGETLGGADPAGADRAMEAMLQMRRIDVEALRAAYAGTAV